MIISYCDKRINFFLYLDFGRRSAAESLPPPPPPPEDEDIHGEDNNEDLGTNANKPSSPDSIISHLSGTIKYIVVLSINICTGQFYFGLH